MAAELDLAATLAETFGSHALLYAFAFLALAIVLFVLEIFIVSFGLLSVAALASAAASIYLAFLANDLAGWAFVTLVPLLAAFVLRWGLRRIRSSGIVTRAEITAEAGYRHVAERIGVAVGSAGAMVTAARPTGRARFAGGECDVQSRGSPLERGNRIAVTEIDGPVIFVMEDDDASRSR